MSFAETITIANRELLVLNATLDAYGHVQDGRLAYTLARNRIVVKPLMEALNAVRQVDPANKELVQSVSEYEDQRIQIGTQFARKDQGGNPMQGPQGFILSNPQAHAQAMAVLDADMPEAAAEKARIVQAWEDALALEIELQLYSIPYRKMPDNVLAARDLATLLEFKVITGEPDWEDEDAAPPKKSPGKSRKRRRN